MKLLDHDIYIQRCFDLAKLGAQNAAPNPMVGAVIVHQNQIIGEGYHKAYGGPHAEVMAVANVPEDKRHLLTESTLYVSLEPCCIFGKTPPCTNLILENKIPKVVISWLDFTPGVSGHGVEILRNKGVEVITNVLKKEGWHISKIRNTFVKEKQPYIILKYAQTKDGFIGSNTGEQFWISNAFSKRLVHKWRSETSGILIGTNTAKFDNPKLNNRYYFGNSPLRIVLDQHNRLDQNLNLFDGKHNTLLVNKEPSSEKKVDQIQLSFDQNFLPQLLNELYKRKISSLIVEGGAQLLNTFLKENLWHEARIFVGNKYLKKGIKAPQISNFPDESFKLSDDLLNIYYNPTKTISQ